LFVERPINPAGAQIVERRLRFAKRPVAGRDRSDVPRLRQIEQLARSASVPVSVPSMVIALVPNMAAAISPRGFRRSRRQQTLT
jgi:hypothetical protein